METQDSCWIPGVMDWPLKKMTLTEIDFIMKGIQIDRGRVDEDLFRERLEHIKKALSPASEMVRVKAGRFQMGNSRDDKGGAKYEKPVHTVTLTYDYWLGRYPVTFWEFDSFCTHTNRDHPGDEGWGRGAQPVIYVSRWDAIAYCNWLSQREGLAVAYRHIGEPDEGCLKNANGDVTDDITQVEGYRLPTEAEWEYAARGGHKGTTDYKYAGSDDIFEVAWCGHNSEEKTHPVGKKKANELGMCDMSGNVRELCHDWFGSYTSENKTNPTGPSSGTLRVLRGGSWYNVVRHCRVAFRSYCSPGDSFSFLGFRLARTIF